eukprot:COSAG01_NODE_6475_length_3644_cov_9.836389_5_plen_76_part_00
MGLLGMGEELDMVRVMAAIDLDGSGEVDLDEFAGWWLELVRRRPHPQPLRPRGGSLANPSQKRPNEGRQRPPRRA